MPRRPGRGREGDAPLAMRATLSTALAAALLAGCREGPREESHAGHPGLSFNARPDIVEQFRRDVAAERHPADGGGRAWLDLAEGDDGAGRAGEARRWDLVYEAGPLGVAVGGRVILLVPPYWGWSLPQLHAPQQVGYTQVVWDAEGVELELAAGSGLVSMEVRGRELREGERIRIAYGAGALGAIADRHAERGSPFWFRVDGDGDGVDAVLIDSPRVDVLPGPPDMLVLTASSTHEPGEPVRLTLSVLDRTASAGLEVEAQFALRSVPEGIEIPPVQLGPEDRGLASIEVVPPDPGIWRFVAEGEVAGRKLLALSNPVRVAEDVTRIWWADLHGHSNLSDGTGLPEEYFHYARNVAALDIVALSDHDHFGVLALDTHPQLWESIERETARFHEPGRFVTLLAFEWTSWLHGHRHVLYFEERGEILSSIDPRYETPEQLWEALRRRSAITIAHHSAGAPVATNWNYAPDPILEPVTEIMSVHGSSEADDSPERVLGFRGDNSVRSALDRGYELGFVGSGDSHDGHPGLSHLSPVYGFRARNPDAGRPFPRLGRGGLAAIRADELTRPAILEALRERRTYATSGPRILLEVELAGIGGGGSVSLRALGESAELRVDVAGHGPLERIDLVRSGEVVVRLELPGLLDAQHAFPLPGLRADEYVYVRVHQANGGLAWSSPIWIRSSEEPGAASK